MVEKLNFTLNDGCGDGYGYGYGDGDGYGYGSGDGYGHGYGDGDGYGHGSGDGYGNGYGSGDGYGHGYGDGDGYGHGSGDGYGNGYGHSYGHGYGDGDDYGHGNGYGNGYGIGSLDAMKIFAEHNAYSAQQALQEPNQEIRRILIEALGANIFFKQLKGKIIHRDIDGCGNPRELIRIPLQEMQAGYVQSVHVVCPTTGREYYLGVTPNVKTCQEAVASTFGLKSDEYNPIRES